MVEDAKLFFFFFFFLTILKTGGEKTCTFKHLHVNEACMITAPEKTSRFAAAVPSPVVLVSSVRCYIDKCP